MGKPKLTKEQLKNFKNASDKYDTVIMMGIANDSLDATVIGKEEDLAKLLIAFFAQAPTMRVLANEVLKSMDQLEAMDMMQNTKPNDIN